MWLFRGRRSPLRRGDTDVERRVRWALLYTWCSWCPGTMKYFLANEMWVFLVMPFLTNQKIIWVIFWLVEIDQSGSRLTNQWGYFVSKYGDVIGSEWGILIGCWNRDSSALSVSCDPVLTRLWSRDCDNSDCLVPKIEFPTILTLAMLNLFLGNMKICLQFLYHLLTLRCILSSVIRY